MPDVTMSATFLGGTVVKAVGFFNMEPWEADSGTATLTLYPRDNKWELFAGAVNDAHGTPLKLSIAGESFRVAGDANFTLQLSAYKNEAVPNSGGNSRHMTLQVKEMGAVKIWCSLAEADRLSKFAQTP
jgi:hypothetical protein